MSSPVIPPQAVEAAAAAHYESSPAHRATWVQLSAGYKRELQEPIRAALEAAAPHMLSHEREQARIAHLDAMVNRETKRAELAEAFAYGWREGKGIPTPVNVDTQEILHDEAQQPTWNFYKDGIDDE